MAGIVKATVSVYTDEQLISPDVCPGHERTTASTIDPYVPRCWLHTDQNGTDVCPFLLWVGRVHRSTSRLADVPSMMDDAIVDGRSADRVSVMCLLASWRHTRVGA